jgi:hypothetical protein
MMYVFWKSVVTIAALLFGDGLAIALGGYKFTVTPDKRQAQDLVSMYRLNAPQRSSNDFQGHLG